MPFNEAEGSRIWERLETGGVGLIGDDDEERGRDDVEPNASITKQYKCSRSVVVCFLGFF